jgi:hypothetical protein
MTQSKRPALLIGARLRVAFGSRAQDLGSHAGTNCVSAMPEASSTFGWYRPQRLLSQSERSPG